MTDILYWILDNAKILLLLLVGGGVIAGFKWLINKIFESLTNRILNKAKKKRDAFAVSRGFKTVDKLPLELSSKLKIFKSVPKINNEQTNSEPKNLYHLKSEEVDFYFINVCYSRRTEDSDWTEYGQALIAVYSNQLNIPTFRLSRNDTLEQLSGNTGFVKNISFEDDPSFSKKIKLKNNTEKDIRAFFKPKLRKAILELGDIVVEASKPNTFCLYIPPNFFPEPLSPKNMDVLEKKGKQVMELFLEWSKE